MQESFINGQYQDSQKTNTDQQRFELYNPATNKLLHHFYAANDLQLEQAIASAKLAQIQWAKQSCQHRIAILKKWAALIKDNATALAELEVLQTGKPIQEALMCDLPTSYGAIEYFSSLLNDLRGDYQEFDSGSCITRFEPLGVVAAIGAWNYPLQIACWKAAPAIAAGNAVVFKPSELTPLTALKLAELAIQAGLPAGLFNVIYGGGDLGERLCSNPDIAKISFTGSVPTGKKIIQASADNITPIILELGGKSPLLIFEDAQIDEAVNVALMANFYTQGAVCSNATRVFVHESLVPNFLEALKIKVAEIRVGDPMQATTQMGALITKKHLESVLEQVNIAVSEGAKILCGGSKVKLAELSDGNFMQPTVLVDCHDSMQIVQQELFGPVMTVLSFKDENEVIQRANSTCFGLAAGVVTNDIRRAHRVVNQLQAGTCWINHYNVTPVGFSFGGCKQSGFGRENSHQTLSQYCRTKSIYVGSEVAPNF